jgi:tetratricopeptide (TPR) repeat protein
MVMAWSVTAFAQSAGPQAAKPIVDDAVSQYNLGHFDEASALFEKAYQLDPAPILLFNIGQCERRLGHNERALFFYRRYLEQAPPSAPERADVDKRVADLERSIRDQADLKDKPPPGVGRDAPPKTAVSTDNGASTVAVPIGPPPVTPPPASDEDPRRRLRTLAWVAGGVGAASLIFGGLEAVAWANRAERFNDHMGPTPADPTGLSRNGGIDEPNRGGAGCASLYDDVSSARTLSIVGLATGGVLAAGSVLLFLMSAPGDSDTTAMGAACVPNPYSPGVTCRVSF